MKRNVVGSIIFGVIIVMMVSSFFLAEPTGNVAVIDVSGTIMGEASGYGSTGSRDYVNLLQQAYDDDTIEAIVLRINSPGGSAVASDEVAEMVLKSEKPVVAQIREVGASGAYWIATSSDHIISNRMSITGSIGVIGSFFDFSGVMDDYNVSYQRFVSGDRKDLGSPFRDMSDDERALLQSKLDGIHEFFIEAVAENRGMDIETLRPLANGEFYLGIEAYNLGLVDELGGDTEVIAWLKTQGVDALFVEYATEPNLMDLIGGVQVPGLHTEFSIRT